MTRLTIDQPAPGFQSDTFEGEPFSLASYRGRKNIVLVFNRGFM